MFSNFLIFFLSFGTMQHSGNFPKNKKALGFIQGLLKGELRESAESSAPFALGPTVIKIIILLLVSHFFISLSKMLLNTV